jgi:hypothetical protein
VRTTEPQWRGGPTNAADSALAPRPTRFGWIRDPERQPDALLVEEPPAVNPADARRHEGVTPPNRVPRRTFSGTARAMPRTDGGASAAGTLLGRHRLDDQISVVGGIHWRCGKSELNLDQSADVGPVEIVG